jgi:hypothetical protein
MQKKHLCSLGCLLNLELMLKVKVKFTLKKGDEGPEAEQVYSSTLSLTSAPDEDGWSMPCPGHFTALGKTGYPLYRRLGGPQGWSGRVRKILPPTRFRS